MKKILLSVVGVLVLVFLLWIGFDDSRAVSLRSMSLGAAILGSWATFKWLARKEENYGKNNRP